MLKSDVHRFYIERGDLAVVEKYCIPTKKDTIFLLESKWKFRGLNSILESESVLTTHFLLIPYSLSFVENQYILWSRSVVSRIILFEGVTALY